MKNSRATFRELFAEGQRVEIPLIQRDYAQGRDDERSLDVRERFLDALAGALANAGTETAPVDLDFVYGRWRNTDKTLEPLDGQQRLTTLFLLHWYLASLDGKFGEFQSWMSHASGGSSFTYRTRPAAREFFDALVGHAAPREVLERGGRAISEWALDSVWFVRGWRRDPTVRGCLTMLDAIHARFCGSKDLWARLVSTAAPPIIFHLLLLENFGLSDDLFVKMNARGKALTPFEVFKAELEQFISTVSPAGPPANPQTTWRDYVSRQFDLAWTDFLWRHRGDTTDIDLPFMHMIRALVLVGTVDSDMDTASPDLAERVGALLANPQPTLHNYLEAGCLDASAIATVVGVMDALSSSPRAPRFLGEGAYVDEAGLLRRVLLARGANLDEGLTLVDWVLFYAWASFLRRWADELEDDGVRGAFHDWMRVVANVARNSELDRDGLIAGLEALKKLSPVAGSCFLEKVAAGKLGEVGGFNEQQLREEKLKAQLIIRAAAWRPLVEEAERHPYFRGSIEFLLRFAGVHARAGDGCDWDDAEDATLRASFGDWYRRACAVFPEESVSWPRPFPDHLWERALLAEGSYLLPAGPNWSFLDEAGRDASWRRLLRADTRVSDRDARRDVVRRVLARIDPADIENSLRAIVAAGVQGADTAPVRGFRKRLVSDPRLIDYCGKRMVRFEDGTAYLMGKAMRNGRHVDLYIYDLDLRLRARTRDIAPFGPPVLTEMTGVVPPSQVRLHARALGATLTVEKPDATMQLLLRLGAPNPAVALELEGEWDTDDPLRFTRWVSPDQTEGVVVALAQRLRAVASGSDAEQM